jgi:TPR repeat protein
MWIRCDALCVTARNEAVQNTISTFFLGKICLSIEKLRIFVIKCSGCPEFNVCKRKPIEIEMKKLQKLLVLVIFLLANLSLWAQNADYYRAAANRGDKVAQHNLGACYYNGTGVVQDYKQAVYWFKKAAEQGVKESQFCLGECYYYGEGVAQDYKQAVYWWTKAANQGDARTQCYLGQCYYMGEGVTSDYKQAVYWYKQSAKQGFAEAQWRMGNCYYLGNGVPRDLAQARFWYKKAFDNPNASEEVKRLANSCFEVVEIEIKEENTSTNNLATTTTTTTQPKQPPQSSSTTSSSYSSNSSTYNKYSRWPLFYSNPVFGFRFGYAQRAFRSKGSVLDINVENPPYLNVFGEHGVMNGFQAGFFVIPSRKSMLTLYFGLNYEMYFCSVKNAQSYSREYKEINLYAPFDLSFHVPFSRRSALYVRGGLGFDYSCYNDYSSLEKNEYGRNASDKFNISWECGLDLKIQGLILYANFQKGITKRYLYGSGNPMELDKISIGLAFGF